MTCKILGLFVITLTADDKYSLLNRDNLRQPIEMHSSKTQRTFSKFVCTFLKSRSKLEHFDFGNYGLRKMWFGKCLKMLVLEDLSTSNILNGLKHCLNLHRSNVNVFID